MRAHQELMSDPDQSAYQYLTGPDRGLTRETIQQFLLGVVPDGDPDYADKAGWITIPYLTPSGAVDLRFRRPPGSDSRAKYKSLPGSQHRLFNPAAILTATEEIYVTEGEMDAMILTQVGAPAVAVPGATAWQKPFALALQGFERIIVCEDGDDTGAGKGLTEAILRDLEWATTVRFEDHDVTSYHQEYGPVALLKKVQPRTETMNKEDDHDYYDEDPDAPDLTPVLTTPPQGDPWDDSEDNPWA